MRLGEFLGDKEHAAARQPRTDGGGPVTGHRGSRDGAGAWAIQWFLMLLAQSRLEERYLKSPEWG